MNKEDQLYNLNKKIIIMPNGKKGYFRKINDRIMLVPIDSPTTKPKCKKCQENQCNFPIKKP